MKMKKLLCVSVATVMTIGMLAGCGGNGNSSTASETYEDNGEKLTLKWLGYPKNPGAEEGSIPETTLEERFNVEIQPLFYEENKYQDKKVMLMAGGEIPDLIYELDPLHVFNDVDQDFIVEVPYDTIKQYAPQYYAYLNEYAPAAWIYSRYEDTNWGVPNYNHSHMLSKNTVYRKDWLDKFNLEVPETLDEMHDALYQFANGDPDGNGKKDTYGISVGSTHYQSYFTEIFGAYGCLPFDWQEVDGQIVYGGLTDECKEALQTLATWYSEGIIHPDFMLGQSDNDKINSGVLGYTVTTGFFDENDPNALINTVKKNNPNAELTIGFLPTGPEGKSGARAWGRAAHVVSFGNTEGHGAKVPRMLKMFEEIFTDKELYQTLKLGKEGETWEPAPADTTKANSYVMLPGYETSDEMRLACLNGDYATPDMFTPVATDYDTYFNSKSEAWKAWATEWTDEKYALTDYFFKVDVVPSSTDYIIDLRTNQMALMSEIIQGIKPIDAYSEFEQEWENGGGKVMTEEANQLKTELNDIYAQIGIQQ